MLGWFSFRKNKFKTNNIIGIYLIEDGNHKIFMKIEHQGFQNNRAKRDIKKYITNYKKINNLSGKWITKKNIGLII